MSAAELAAAIAAVKADILERFDVDGDCAISAKERAGTAPYPRIGTDPTPGDLPCGEF